MKTRVLIKDGEYKLGKAFCMHPKIDAEELFCYLTGQDRVGVFLKADEEVDEEIEKKYNELIEKRMERIPLQYITGEQEFMGNKFKVTPDVLIPRPETEGLVAKAAKIIQEVPREKPSLLDRLMNKRGWEVLDLCCGSGAIGVSLSKICSNINVTASDISDKAIEVAKENALSNRVKIKFKEGNLFEPHEGELFDMIISNPPYIKTNMISILQEEVKEHEPLVALDGGKDGLDFYKKIVANATEYLKEEGFLLMEIGYDQGKQLKEILENEGEYEEIEVIRDLAGRDRIVKCKKKL